MSGAVCAELLTSLLDTVPELIADDAKVGALEDVPLLVRKWALHFRSLPWLALGPGPSPDQPANIPLIHEEAADGRDPPDAAAVPAARRWGSGLVEFRQNSCKRATFGIPLKDAAHDNRFGGIDLYPIA